MLIWWFGGFNFYVVRAWQLVLLSQHPTPSDCAIFGWGSPKLVLPQPREKASKNGPFSVGKIYEWDGIGHCRAKLFQQYRSVWHRYIHTHTHTYIYIYTTWEGVVVSCCVPGDAGDHSVRKPTCDRALFCWHQALGLSAWTSCASKSPLWQNEEGRCDVTPAGVVHEVDGHETGHSWTDISGAEKRAPHDCHGWSSLRL